MNEKENTVRVVCYVPLRTNQILQAHASLNGMPKQNMVAEILEAHAETLDIAVFRKERESPEKKPVKRISKKKKTVSDNIANDIEG